MTTPERRQALYTKMLRFMTSHKANAIPVDLPGLCRSAGIDLVPLSTIVSGTGLTCAEVFSIWGNQDGAVNVYGNRCRIAYNDARPEGRTRFTICEEIAHWVYSHTDDPSFNMFGQRYSNDTYFQYDEEARLGAGLLICHPKFFYTHERFLTTENLSAICRISLPCAETRRQVFVRYRQEITTNITYQFSTIPHAKENLWKYEKACRMERLRA